MSLCFRSTPPGAKKYVYDGQQAESGIIFRSSQAVMMCLLEKKKNNSDIIYLRAVNQAGQFDKYSQNIQNM